MKKTKVTKKHISKKNIIHEKNIKLRYRIAKILYVIGAVELVIFSYFSITANKTIMNDITLATTVQPERFTELYFENHLSLPSAVTIGTSYSFTFTIHNLEYRDTLYPYDVYILNPNGSKTLIDKNAVMMKNNQYFTHTEKFILTQDISRQEVVVNLTSKNQQIDFWITGSSNTNQI